MVGSGLAGKLNEEAMDDVGDEDTTLSHLVTSVVSTAGWSRKDNKSTLRISKYSGLQISGLKKLVVG